MANVNRLAKINEEILRELCVLIPRLKDPRIQGLVSVTRVDTTRDMRFAKVYVSVLSNTVEPKEVIKGLKSAAGFLRRETAATLTLRMAPQFLFELDTSIEVGAHILTVLHSIQKHEEEPHDAE